MRTVTEAEFQANPRQILQEAESEGLQICKDGEVVLTFRAPINPQFVRIYGSVPDIKVSDELKRTNPEWR